MPKWRNIATVFKTRWTFLLYFVLFYSLVTLAYVGLKWNKDLCMDAYQIMLIGLQMVLYLSTYVHVKRTFHRIYVTICYHCATLVYIISISFYMLIITSNICYPQIKTKYDLIREQFRFETDSYTMELLRQNQMVCTIATD